MAHLLIAFKRKDGLSLADFSRHWREVHAPLAKRMPGLRGYVQNHSSSVVSRIQTYDGVVEIWMASEAALTAAFRSKEYREGAYADEPNFADVKNVVRARHRRPGAARGRGSHQPRATDQTAVFHQTEA